MSIRILTVHHDEVPWIQDYINKVIKEAYETTVIGLLMRRVKKMLCKNTASSLLQKNHLYNSF